MAGTGDARDAERSEGAGVIDRAGVSEGAGVADGAGVAEGAGVEELHGAESREGVLGTGGGRPSSSSTSQGSSDQMIWLLNGVPAVPGEGLVFGVASSDVSSSPMIVEEQDPNSLESADCLRGAVGRGA